MSGRVVRIALEAHVGGAVRKAVLVNLAERAHDDGTEARPAVETIAQECEVSERAVRRALAELREQGVIVETARATQHRPTVYRLELDILSDLHVVHPWEDARPARGAPLARPGVHVSPPGVHVTTARGARGAPEPYTRPEPSTGGKNPAPSSGPADRPEEWVCGQCDQPIVGDELTCPHCGHVFEVAA